MIEVSKPDLLGRFAYQVVWRFAVCKFGPGAHSLGPYEEKLRDCIFFSNSQCFPVFLAKSHLTIRPGDVAGVAILPFRTKLADWNVWMFAVGGVHFYLKLDNRPFPSEWHHYTANQRKTCSLLQIEEKSVADVPILKPFLYGISKAAERLN